jgi:hypothetical protein
MRRLSLPRHFHGADVKKLPGPGLAAPHHVDLSVSLPGEVRPERRYINAIVAALDAVPVSAHENERIHPL